MSQFYMQTTMMMMTMTTTRLQQYLTFSPKTAMLKWGITFEDYLPLIYGFPLDRSEIAYV